MRLELFKKTDRTTMFWFHISLGDTKLPYFIFAIVLFHRRFLITLGTVDPD